MNAPPSIPVAPIRRWIRDPITWISQLLIWGGLVVARHESLFYLATALGLFGPGLLREIGVLRWRDEFEREANRSAAFHALVMTGFVSFGVMAVEGVEATYREGSRAAADAVPASAIVVVMVITFVVSRLLQFWGLREGARRLYWLQAAVWGLPLLVVGIAEVVSGAPLDTLVSVSLPVVVLVCAGTWAPRKPRLVGGTMALLLGWTFSVHMRWTEFLDSGVPWAVRLVIMFLVLVPAVVPTLGLLFQRPDPDRR